MKRIWPERLFFLLNALDVLFTWLIATKAGTIEVECNPVALWILQSSGWWGLILFKVVGTAIVAMSTNKVGSDRIKWWLWVWNNTWMTGVVIWSIYLYCW